MSFAFIGGPGSGKGTQSKRLSEYLKMPLFVMGDALRNKLKEEEDAKGYLYKQEEKQEKLRKQHKDVYEESLVLKDKPESIILGSGGNDFYVEVAKKLELIGEQLKNSQDKMVSQEKVVDRAAREYKNLREIVEPIRSCLERGVLVPDLVAGKVLAAYMEEHSNVILDGFPRSIEQVKMLSDLIQKDNLRELDLVIYLELSREEMMARLAGRFSCNKCGAIYNLAYRSMDRACTCGSRNFSLRKDDENMKSVKARIEAFEENIDGIEGYYSKKGTLFKVSGIEKVDQIFHKIAKKVNSTRNLD